MKPAQPRPEDEATILADARSNLLVVVATSELMGQIETLLEQILVNLVRNAGDATAGDGAIEIRTGRAESGELAAIADWDRERGAAIRLEVADDGAGMSAEQQAHLFEPFFTTKEPGRGTGLGLASVYGIVQQSGGAIAVESRAGAGTTFRIFLPEVAGA